MIRLLAALVAIGLALGTAPAGAQERPDHINAQDWEDVLRFQDYLNGVRTVRSDFVQIIPQGQDLRRIEGTLHIKRPGGKMRVEYEPPIDDLLVSTGIYLIRYDAEMEQSTYLPLRASPASVLLEDELILTEHVNVQGVVRSDNLIHIEISRDGTGESGSIVLSFSKDPMQLAQWTVIDPQGTATEVRLVEPEFNVELSDDLFTYMQPTPGWDPDNPDAGNGSARPGTSDWQ